MIKIIIAFALLLLPISSFAVDQESSIPVALSATISTLIIPSLPGALLLFVISILISTLTFYADLKRSDIPSRGSNRYLALWIFGNFSFALVLLVLILPEGTRLDVIDRTLLLYCIIASGLPEVSAYIKIQLGNSDKGVNLYKIREMFTSYIARRVSSSEETSEWEDMQLFKYTFIGRIDLLNEKLIAFSNVCNFSDTEKNEILACLPSAKNNNIDSSIDCLMSLNDLIKIKLFNFFREDIRRYQSSSSAKLVRKLYPPISAMEAQSLVTNGVISPLRFFMKTFGNTQRSKLSDITKIDNSKLALLHNELKGIYRQKFRRFILGIFSLIVFLAISSLILGTQMEKTLSYTNIVPEGEMSLPEQP